MSDEAIRTLVDRNPGQATFEEYKLLHTRVVEGAPCNLLIFGVGRDSSLWLDSNAGGRTIFLENVAEWAAFARNAVAGIDVREVDYGIPRRFMWPLMRRFEARLYMRGLPGDVLSTSWDVIVVDAPQGTRWYRFGRMKSIYTAGILARESRGDVFVHDCYRKVEREASDQFLCAGRLVAQAGSMRHYRFA